MFEPFLLQLESGEDLSVGQSQTAMDLIMRGEVPDDRIARFLLALNRKGFVAAEIVGAARTLRSHMTRIESNHKKLLDTCGTGGDGSGTFNISTAAAFVVAACDIPVAKHGNRSISSKSGSADALQRLGVNVTASLEVITRCLNELGICFCFAPLFHGAMKNVATVRKQLGVPTIFNILGPLCNPASASFQLLGVGKSHFRVLLAEALRQLGTERSIVVFGEDGLCEISNGAETSVSWLEKQEPNGLPTIKELRWTPTDFGLTKSSRKAIQIDGPAESAQMISEVLNGTPSAARDIVVMNAAAALRIAGKSNDLLECTHHAQEAIDSGNAKQKLDQLIRLSQNQ
jgi:anthranilate phosphoribosyltransferase